MSFWFHVEDKKGVRSQIGMSPPLYELIIGLIAGITIGSLTNQVFYVFLFTIIGGVIGSIWFFKSLDGKLDKFERQLIKRGYKIIKEELK